MTMTPVMPNFQINDVEMPSPTNIQWNLPEELGINGSGRRRLSPFGSAKLTWNFMDFDDYTTLREAWDNLSGTSASVRLPTFYGYQNSSTWDIYSGVIIDIPRPNNPYTVGYHTAVEMTIRRVNIYKKIPSMGG